MKVIGTFEFEAPKDIHGDDIEKILKEKAEQVSGSLKSWSIGKI